MAASKLFGPLLLLFLVGISVRAQKTVIDLNEENWDNMLTGHWMVKFYAPWCPACKGMQPIWKEYATLSQELGIKVAQVDVTTSPGLSGRFMVTALPTIFHVINGDFRQYKGTRDKESLVSFVEETKWTSVEPIPGWKSPTSMQMSIVSSFFKLSQILRAIHTQLMEDYGLPTWGSYLIFALATIVLGALLGLVLVFIIDWIYPPRSSSTRMPTNAEKHQEKNSGDEMSDEDVKYDLLDDVNQSEGEAAEEKLQSEPGSPNVKKRKPRKAD